MTFTCNSSQLQSTDSFEVFILWTSVYDETAAPVIRNLNTHPVRPRAGSGVVRMDPLRFLAGCRTRRLNQA